MSVTTETQAPVANLAQAKKELAAAKRQSKDGHPAGSAKAPAKEVPAKKAAEAKAEKTEAKEYTATGRSGQETIRSCPFEAKFAVDVQRPGKKASYAAGVIVRFFASKEAAQKFADEVNSGEMAKRNDWYAEASNAIVVAAKEA